MRSLSIPCPKCKSPVGHTCNVNGTRIHKARIVAALAARTPTEVAHSFFYQLYLVAYEVAAAESRAARLAAEVR